jgi:argininosuccinate lyase
MDAVSSRDFALELLSSLGIMMTHASRVCEELVVWSSGFARFVELDDAFCSTSSIMPQKKNPDTAEVMRAKAGSVLGSATAAFAIGKALPLSYNRDLQELNPHLWRGIRDAKQSTRLLVDMLSSATFNTAAMAEEAGRGYSTATEVADMLVQSHGFAFRTAHTLVGKAIQKGGLDLPTLDRAAEEMGLAPLSKMGVTGNDIAAALDVQACIDRRRAKGSPSPFAVKISLSSRNAILAEDSRILQREDVSLRRGNPAPDQRCEEGGGGVSEFLSGDLVRCVVGGSELKGTYITSRDGMAVLKVDSGYNMGSFPATALHRAPCPMKPAREEVIQDPSSPCSPSSPPGEQSRAG